MRKQVISWGRLTCGAGVVVLLPSLATAGTMTIATGPSSAVDGYLAVAPDDYGAWADTTFGGSGDVFNPLGVGPSLAPAPATFTSGFFLFTGGQRELLTDNVSWQGVVSADASLDRTVTGALVASDTNGDGVDDTLTSSFRVFGGSTSLSFDLTQRVIAVGAGVSLLRQQYTITNDSPEPISMNLVRSYDGDLVWSGDFSNDEVGTSMHGAGLGPYVFEQEASDPGVTAITLSSLEGSSYYGGRHGVVPGGAGTPFDFGTDTELWDAFGIPGNWVDYVAGVGYGTNGVSGTSPPGSTVPQDGFTGLDFNVDLEGGGSAIITVYHSYGQNSPAPECPGDIDGSGDVGFDDLLAVLSFWGPCPSGSPCPEDLDGDLDVGFGDLLIVLSRWGSCP